MREGIYAVAEVRDDGPNLLLSPFSPRRLHEGERVSPELDTVELIVNDETQHIRSGNGNE